MGPFELGPCWGARHELGLVSHDLACAGGHRHGDVLTNAEVAPQVEDGKAVGGDQHAFKPGRVFLPFFCCEREVGDGIDRVRVEQGNVVGGIPQGGPVDEVPVS